MGVEPIDWSVAGRYSSALSVYLLGAVDFKSCLILMERMRHQVANRKGPGGFLILCEHAPIVTIGRSGSYADLPDERELDSRLISKRWVNRSGGTLLHSPGQLAIYPILPMDRLGITESEVNKALTVSTLKVCEERKIPAWADEADGGVWSRCGKIGFNGLSSIDDVTTHGMFLNVSPDLFLTRLVRSVSETQRVGSLAAQSSRTVPMASIREGLARHLASEINYNDVSVRGGHPLLKRRKQRVARLHAPTIASN